MRPEDQIAYLAVKAMKWIIQNTETKDEADKVLEAMQHKSAKEVMHNLVKWNDLRD